ncbi:glycosyltransferase N-terminal domain-containing protein [Candidatus Pelagibacter bacterium nBUS_32]|uniref:glycosyltransferase N-terminal domain-containing protein n=1 Tax=Candidatus Pelagibacter bacterium nBUS_32 TaxID=3374192 RepID=UPI003EB71B63
MFFLYQTILTLVIIISPIIISYRILKNKEDKKRFLEKFCFFSKKRRSGKLIWFHGSSVGELLSIIPIIEQYEKKKQ